MNNFTLIGRCCAYLPMNELVEHSEIWGFGETKPTIVHEMPNPLQSQGGVVAILPHNTFIPYLTHTNIDWSRLQVLLYELNPHQSYLS